jgi:hypothetical protein
MFHKYQPDSQKFSAFYGSLKHILEQQFRMVYYYTSLMRRFIITRMCLKHDEHSVLLNKCNIGTYYFIYFALLIPEISAAPVSILKCSWSIRKLPIFHFSLRKQG